MMKTVDKTIRKVALMNFDADESVLMAGLDTLWVQTMDLEHMNVLAYPVDIMVDKVEELYPLKYINTNDFHRYIAENGSEWLLSNSLTIEDVDRFFNLYLHLDEEELVA